MSTNRPRQSIAIIGSGIAGLSCAFHLHKDFNITVFEKETTLGGHTDTHELVIGGAKLNIDSGFIVFCYEHYPHFSAMLDSLCVTSQATNMSLSVHNRKSGLLYNATSLNGLFCQRKNLFNRHFYRMLWDLVRFYQSSTKALNNTKPDTSVSEFLKQHNYSTAFSEDHLYPMISALWSATPSDVKAFPVRHLIDYLSKHGMLNLVSRPQWRVIQNGSKRYIEALKQQIVCDWKTNTPISSVKRSSQGVSLTSSTGQTQQFDAVIFATHADQALALIDQPSDNELAIFGNMQFAKNHIIVHTDESVMPANKRAWASWNTEVPSVYKSSSLQCCTANYWMNLLQNLPCKENIFTSLNSHQDIDQDKILLERHYSHPIFNAKSVAAQQQKHLIDGQLNSYFVGAYWGWGFHEDGAHSAAEVSAQIKARYFRESADAH